MKDIMKHQRENLSRKPYKPVLIEIVTDENLINEVVENRIEMEKREKEESERRAKELEKANKQYGGNIKNEFSAID